MTIPRRFFLATALSLLGRPAASAEPLAPAEIVRQMLNTDAWGLGEAEVSARAIIKDERGSQRELAFSARSRRHAPPLTKSLVRFRAPADLAGVGFLQIQKADDDDDRYLFLPELGKARRIAGNTRGSAFMGTDFTYADLDRRDLREGTAVLKGQEDLGKFPCYHLEVIPKRADSPYARLEIWVRTDNFVPLKTLMYNRAGVLLKTLVTLELRRIDGRWFLTRSRMTDHAAARTTELVLDNIQPKSDVPDDEFTVRNLEKN
jgi:hypothetical protein